MKRQFLKICTLKIDDETKSPKSKLKKGGIIYLDSNKGECIKKNELLEFSEKIM